MAGDGRRRRRGRDGETAGIPIETRYGLLASGGAPGLEVTETGPCIRIHPRRRGVRRPRAEPAGNPLEALTSPAETLDLEARLRQGESLPDASPVLRRRLELPHEPGADEAGHADPERSSEAVAPSGEGGTVNVPDGGGGAATRPDRREWSPDPEADSSPELLTSPLTDIHSHLLPGVDDGAVDEDEMRAAIERVYSSGVRLLAVTPHMQVSTLNRPDHAGAAKARIDASWRALSEHCARERPDLELRRGTELMIDDPRPRLEDEWLRLGGSRHVLIEFSGMWFPPRYADVLRSFVDSGFTPVIGHPERYGNLNQGGTVPTDWRDRGVRLQVNCGSLLGHYGTAVRDRAWYLLEHGLVDCLASDYHARGAYPLGDCLRLLEETGGADFGKLLLAINPARLLRGADPLPVPSLKKPQSFLRRLSQTKIFGNS
jgi:protein-tyrosine phosphatase